MRAGFISRSVHAILQVSVWWRELGEVENECTSYNFSPFAIFLPKIIKTGGNLTKFWQNKFAQFFSETRCTFPAVVRMTKCNTLYCHLTLLCDFHQILISHYTRGAQTFCVQGHNVLKFAHISTAIPPYNQMIHVWQYRYITRLPEPVAVYHIMMKCPVFKNSEHVKYQ